MSGLAGVRRRGFLGVSAAGLALLAGGGGWLWLDSREATYRALIGDWRGLVLTTSQLAVLDALAGAVITPAHGAPTARQAQIARRIDRELVFHPGSKLAADVVAALALFERLPLLDGLGARFTALAPEARQQVLARSVASPWALRRLAFAGLKFLILFFYYSDERTWDSIGYAGPLVAEKWFEGGNRIANLAPLASDQNKPSQAGPAQTPQQGR